MARIVGGSVGGRRLVVPAGRGTRPTSDRVREALFAALDARCDLPGARVLDLYAGSGALGLEAASRGATSVVLVESGREAVASARRNVTALGLPGVTVVAAPVRRFLERAPDHGSAGAGPAAADLVLLDPPYSLAEVELAQVLEALVGGGWLAPAAVVIAERSRRTPEPTWPAGLGRVDERRYGETTLWWAEYRGPSGHLGC
jgi:16S rRNA (guanine966-N2)-methyltransferase